MIDFVGRKQWFFLVSWLLVAVGIAAVIISQVHFGSPLLLGTAFTGGTSFNVHFSTPVDQSQFAQEMTKLGYGGADIRGGPSSYSVTYGAEISDQQKQALQNGLAADLGTQVDITDYSFVSGTIGAGTARNAGIAVIVAAVAMLFYIVWAFRRMPNPLRWGACAIIALVHDVFIVVGVFALLGLLAGVRIDTLFITGLLTVVGYSINNTVVVYDRVRENKTRGISSDFAVTTLFVILALFMFGGITIHYFVLVLLLGVTIGLYDSVCIAGELLVVWETGDWRSLIPWPRKTAQPELSR
jgi:preprotein translocase subunit SecF